MSYRRRSAGRLGLLLVLVLALLLAACGRKTMPVPPERVEPAPVTDLSYRLDGQEVILSWTAPDRTVAGSRLTAVEGFEVLRAVVPEAKYCPGCPLTFGPPIRFSGQAPQPGKTISYAEKSLLPGHRYFYKVRTRFGWHLTSRDSNLVSFSCPENENPPLPTVEPTP